MTDIKECGECEQHFDYDYVVDAWNNKLKRFICDLCRSGDDE